jgi:hypothetical protein
MLDTDTFVTALYVTVDETCKMCGIPPHALPQHRGPRPALAPSEVITLALLAQWGRFPSERGFYRVATTTLRPAFPRLPDRTRYNRLLRAHQPAILCVGQTLGAALAHTLEPDARYEVLDTTAVPTRNFKRGGSARSWLAGQAALGHSTRLGWFEGLRLLAAVSPRGVLTGFGFGAGNAKEQALTEVFLAARADARLASALPSVGRALASAPAVACYVADAGFHGHATHARWTACYAAQVVTPPGGNWITTSRERWPRAWRRWLSRHRQIVESVFERLLFTFRLSRERPHSLAGFAARLAATATLYNACLTLNHQLGRPLLALADLVAW